MPTSCRDPWARALDHLSAVDSRWASIFEQVGPCRLRPRRDRFGTLVRAIIGQQISSKAAASIDLKLRTLVGDPHTPEPLLAAGEGILRSAGLSGVKSRYVLNLAEAVATGRVPLRRIGRLSDERVVEALTSVTGIGRWTAEMFLIFALNRPDVWPLADLGLKVGLQRFYGLADRPGSLESVRLAEPWRPFRSVAMWYFWRLSSLPGRRT